MTTGGMGDEPTVASTPPPTTPVTAQRPITSGFEATVVTAEIPVTTPLTSPTGARHAGDDALYERLQPAPAALRVAVWLLFFVFLIALIALAVEHYHPDWLSFLRNSSASSSLPVLRGPFPFA